MYKYEEQKSNLFTESGTRTLLSMRDRVKELLAESGAFMSQNAFTTGDVWTMMAALDFMAEEGYVREIHRDCAGQHRVFVEGPKG